MTGAPARPYDASQQRTLGDRAALLHSRISSGSRTQRYIHSAKFAKIVRRLEPDDAVLEVGRGGSVDGLGALAAAAAGIRACATVPTELHAQALRLHATQTLDPEAAERFSVVVCPPHRLDGVDGTFTVVMALHVLEHVRDPDAVLAAMRAKTADRLIVALPTCANVAALCRLGGGDPYGPISAANLRALVRGTARGLVSIARGRPGLAESQVQDGAPWKHTWLWPWVLTRAMRGTGLEILHAGPDALPFPFFGALVPLSRWLDRANLTVLRHCGMGTHLVLRPSTSTGGGPGTGRSTDTDTLRNLFQGDAHELE